MIMEIETVDRDGDQQFGQACVAWIRKQGHSASGELERLDFTFLTGIISSNGHKSLGRRHAEPRAFEYAGWERPFPTRE